MDEIKEEIAAKGLENNIPSFEDVIFGKPVATNSLNLYAIKKEIDNLRNNEVHYYRELTSSRKTLSPIIIFIKRVIRKLCRFLGEPTVKEINEYHHYVIKTLEQIISALEQLDFKRIGNTDEMLEIRQYRVLAERFATSNYNLSKEISGLKTELEGLKATQNQLMIECESAKLSAEVSALTLKKMQIG